jgi:hypothetical protein
MKRDAQHRPQKWEPVLRGSDAMKRDAQHRPQKWEPVLRGSDALKNDARSGVCCCKLQGLNEGRFDQV